MCVSAAGAAAAAPAGPLEAWQVLLFWRFLLGVGIGGEYPLSGAVTAEHASAESSAWQMAGLNLCFLLGQVLAPLVVLACFYAGVSDQATWRAGVGGGAVLALLGALLRGATMFGGKSWAESREGTLWNVLKIVALSAPGYFFTFCIGRFGRRCFQCVGFTVMGIAFFLMSFLYGRGVGGLEVIIFGVQKSFDAMGPGATTFIIPAEIFPTVIRASCHGLSAASGKVGAFVGTLFLPPVQDAVGFQMVLAGCGLLCLLGLLLTFVLTPPYDAETLRVLAETAKTDPGGTTRILWSRRRGTLSDSASVRNVG
ncbi:unnamed protein product [Prorocentrum cordatum]|uniref:Major facilitator superfamily (MFS) profile domain-containing protein n=1 Tax=Prorocentrum cordatum TaxID=2364126 RepID=A0ABN9VZ98_9DINO|nr:unnamed protein product [Polarella glacialis]